MKINKGLIGFLIGAIISILLIYLAIIALNMPSDEVKIEDKDGNQCYIIENETAIIVNNTIVFNGTLKPAIERDLNDFQLIMTILCVLGTILLSVIFLISIDSRKEYWEYKTKRQIEREKKEKREKFFNRFRDYVQCQILVEVPTHPDITKDKIIKKVISRGCPFSSSTDPINYDYADSSYYGKHKHNKEFRNKLIEIVKDVKAD